MIRSEKRANLRLLRHSDLTASLPEGDAVNENQSVAEEHVIELEGASEIDRSFEAKQIAMRALANREHSRGELVQKLARKGIDRDLACAVVAELADDGLQSEGRFVESFVRSRIERGYGPILIRQELRQREVGDDHIDEHLTHDHAFWTARASRAVEKRFKALPETRDEWGRQARYLSRRGFPAELIYASLGDQR